MPNIPENHIVEFFRKLERIPFPENVLREQIPVLIGTWDAIGKCLSVPWKSVMMQVVVHWFLHAYSVVQPSVDVHSLLQCFFFHQPNQPLL